MSHQCNAYCIAEHDIHCTCVYMVSDDPSAECALDPEHLVAIAPAGEAPSWGRYLHALYHVPVVETSRDPQPYLLYWRQADGR